MNKQNLRLYTKNFMEIERLVETGYIDPSIAFKVELFGRVDLSNGSGVQLLSSFNNLNPFLDTSTTLYIASTDSDDKQDLIIEYISQDRESLIKTVTLNGTTPVDVGDDIYCAWKMSNYSSDNISGTVSLTTNAGGVPADDSEVYSQIFTVVGVPTNKSMSSFYSVPTGFSGFFTKASLISEKGSDVRGGLFARPFQKTFLYEGALSSYQSQSINRDAFIRANEKTDFKPLGAAQTGGIVDIEYTILCINNDYLDNHLQG